MVVGRGADNRRAQRGLEEEFHPVLVAMVARSDPFERVPATGCRIWRRPFGQWVSTPSGCPVGGGPGAKDKEGDPVPFVNPLVGIFNMAAFLGWSLVGGTIFRPSRGPGLRPARGRDLPSAGKAGGRGEASPRGAYLRGLRIEPGSV